MDDDDANEEEESSDSDYDSAPTPQPAAARPAVDAKLAEGSRSFFRFGIRSRRN